MFEDGFGREHHARRPGASPRDFIAFLLLLWLLCALAMSPAKAHSWFPWSCCSNLDCFEIGEGKAEPAPTAGPGGWRLYDGTVIPFAEARPSPDGKFYVCRKQGKSDGEVIHPAGEKPCLWVPQMGF
jgi:hypothetical protein